MIINSGPGDVRAAGSGPRTVITQPRSHPHPRGQLPLSTYCQD